MKVGGKLMRARVLSLCALLGSAACFSPALPLTQALRLVRGGVCRARMIASKPLDPMQLIQDKALQTCALRPIKSKQDNAGLSTATFALG